MSLEGEEMEMEWPQLTQNANNSNNDSTTTCSDTPYDRSNLVGVAVVSMSVALVSLVMCCLTLALMALLKKWQFFSQRLLLYLTIVTTLSSLANLLSPIAYIADTTPPHDATVGVASSEGGGGGGGGEGFCAFAGFFTQVTTWMTLCSISSITLYLLVRTTCDRNTQRLEWLYAGLTFALPLLLNWIPFLSDSYGRDVVWCWIRSYNYNYNNNNNSDSGCTHNVGKWLQLGLLYVPLYSVMLILVILYVVIIVTIFRRRRRLTGGDGNPHGRKVLRKIVSEVVSLMAYPVIYIVLCLPPLLNLIYSLAASSGGQSLVLLYLSGVAYPLQGACTGLTFLLHAVVCRRMTWAELRAAAVTGTQGGRRRESSSASCKARVYPMKTDEVSDSIIHPVRYDPQNHRTEQTAPS